jgi:hypothetical protein
MLVEHEHVAAVVGRIREPGGRRRLRPAVVHRLEPLPRIRDVERLHNMDPFAELVGEPLVLEQLGVQLLPAETGAFVAADDRVERRAEVLQVLERRAARDDRVGVAIRSRTAGSASAWS